MATVAGVTLVPRQVGGKIACISPINSLDLSRSPSRNTKTACVARGRCGLSALACAAPVPAQC